MNLNHLAYFRVLGNTEHYTKAATELNITQPSLSHAIRSLEQDLDTELFEKQGRNVKLTKYGKMFHSVVDKALRELEEGENELRNCKKAESGQIELAFLYTLGSHFVPSLINEFWKTKESSNVTFSFFQASTKDIIEGLKEGRFDLGLCTYQSEEPEISFTKLCPQPLIAIVPKSHPLAELDAVTLEQLKEEPFVAYNHLNSLRAEIDELFYKENLSPNIVCEVTEEAAIAGLVSISYGVSIIPDVRLANSYPVKKLKILTPQYDRYLYIASLKNSFMSPGVASFSNFLSSLAKC